jgi:dTDP-4-amino-4,6-dideoxygalactose transaminase
VGAIGDIGAWSFCQDKIMTTGGEGGMVTTDQEDLWSTAWSYKDHGKSWDAVHNRQHPPGYRFVHESFGTNWRMLEMQAAIGLIQLGSIETWTRRRTEIAHSFARALMAFPNAIRVPMPGEKLVHAYYRLYAYVRPDGLRPNWTRDRVVSELAAQGVQIMHGTCSEVYLERAFGQTGFAPKERLPLARELGETSIALLTHPTMQSDEVQRTCHAISAVFSKASR